MPLNLAFLRPKKRQPAPGLCLVTDAAKTEAMLREWQQELLADLDSNVTDSEAGTAQTTGGERG
jgi:hypothetical protein